MSLAIANEAIKRGYGVIYASAPQLVSKLEKIYFSKGSEKNLKLTTQDDLEIFQALLQEGKKNELL